MATEFAFGDEIMVLDGRVLEVFHSGTEESLRYHVSYLRIDATPNGAGFKVRLGRASGANDIAGGRQERPGRPRRRGLLPVGTGRHSEVQEVGTQKRNFSPR